MKKIIIFVIIVAALIIGYSAFVNEPTAVIDNSQVGAVQGSQPLTGNVATDLANLERENQTTNLSSVDADFAAEVNAAVR